MSHKTKFNRVPKPVNKMTLPELRACHAQAYKVEVEAADWCGQWAQQIAMRLCPFSPGDKLRRTNNQALNLIPDSELPPYEIITVLAVAPINVVRLFDKGKPPTITWRMRISHPVALPGADDNEEWWTKMVGDRKIPFRKLCAK